MAIHGFKGMNVSKVRLTVLLSIAPLVAISGIVAARSLNQEHAVAAEPAGSTPEQTIEWGDIDCNEGITPRDWVSILRHLIRVQDLSQTEPCPDLGSDQHMVSPYDRSIVWGDVDCSGTLDAVDALLLDQTVLHLAPVVPTAEQCPGVSSSVQLAAEQPTHNAIPTPAPNPTMPASSKQFDVTVSLKQSGVASLTVLINYDPSSAVVVVCSPSNVFFCNAQYGPGEIGIDGVDASGFTTGFQIAHIEFFALSGTILTHSTITATDTNGHTVDPQLDIQPSELLSTPEVTATPSPTPRPSPAPTPTSHLIRQRGDLNCDGTISISDILPVLRATAGLSALNFCTVNAGNTAFDLNCDGAVSGQDALDLARFVIHLPVSLPSSCPSMVDFVIVY